jgi:hypothetical protein
MRILKAFLTSLIILAVLAGLGFLATREVLLMMATTKVKQSLKWIRDVDNAQQYAAECSAKGATKLDTGQIHFTQLRYTGPNTYIVEVICHGRQFDPIQISEEKLPSLVRHKVGQSGLRWGADQGLDFECLNRIASVSVVEGVIQTALKPSEVETKPGPPTECSAYGYSCCDPNTQQGRSDQITEAIDCPQACYRTCRERPLVLNFSTQPYYDKLNRQLTISSGQSVTFSFTVSPNQEPVLSGYYDETDKIERTIAMLETVFKRQDPELAVTVLLDYGDGSRDEFHSLRGQAEHVYHCSQPSCEYTANLKVVKENGAVSIDGLQNQIYVQVN